MSVILPMTVAQIENNDNKVTPSKIAMSPSGSAAYYADAIHYPSMQTALDIAHPVGSVICMSSNTNPSTTLGGTWTLVDKELSYRWHDLYASGGWSATYATAQTTAGARIGGHAMDIRLELTTTTALSDSTIELGYINPNALGITEFPLVYRYVPFSYDGGGVRDVVGQTVITNAGRITVEDIWNADNGHTYASGSNLALIYHFSSIPFNYMLDSYCDKFYFKRTS